MTIGRVAVPKESCVKHNLFVISAFDPTDCGVGAEKDEFHDERVTFVLRRKYSGIVLVAFDLNA